MCSVHLFAVGKFWPKYEQATLLQIFVTFTFQSVNENYLIISKKITQWGSNFILIYFLVLVSFLVSCMGATLHRITLAT